MSEKKDFGGCRCQAFMISGDATNADPVCSKSDHHYILEEQVATAQNVQKKVDNEKPIILYRNDKNSKEMSKRKFDSPDGIKDVDQSNLIVVANNIVKLYGDVRALNQFSIKIRKGGVFQLLGPNGSGKTTSIHVLATSLAQAMAKLE